MSAAHVLRLLVFCLGALALILLIGVGALLLLERIMPHPTRCAHFTRDSELHWYYIGHPPERTYADTWTMCPRGCWRA